MMGGVHLVSETWVPAEVLERRDVLRQHFIRRAFRHGSHHPQPAAQVMCPYRRSRLQAIGDIFRPELPARLSGHERDAAAQSKREDDPDGREAAQLELKSD